MRIINGIVLLGCTFWAINAVAQDVDKDQLIDPTPLSGQTDPSKPGDTEEVDQMSSSICQHITCSGHGVCVVKGGEPLCACNNNYAADQRTGMNCIPIAGIDSTPNVPESVASNSQAVSANTRLLIINQNRRYLHRTKMTGVVLFITGVIITIGGGVFAPIIAVVGGKKLAGGMVGLVSGVVGLSLIIPGTSLIIKGKKGIRRLDRVTGNLALRSVGPIVTSDGKISPSLVLNFTF